MGKRTRNHSRWRDDQDYAHRLPEAERAWLAKFRDEYYRYEFGEAPLHAAGTDARSELYRAQDAAARDILTVSEAAVAEAHARPVAARACLRVRFYAPDDYAGELARLTPSALEDAIIDGRLDVVQAIELAVQSIAPGRRRARA